MPTNHIPTVRLVLCAFAAALLALAPRRAAADPPAIVVSNANNVLGFSATGAPATGYTAPAGFSNAQGVAYNPANNTIYVADSYSSKIRTFNASTGAETSIGFANATELYGPGGLALNAGVLYVANFSADTILAFNAATGQAVADGFTAPTGLNSPFGLAVRGTTLFVSNLATDTLGAYNLATGAAVPGFTPPAGLNSPVGVALYGNDLFVANYGLGTVGEYDATTGAVLNERFVFGLSGAWGLAVLGDRLLVANTNGTTVGAYGIPAAATIDNRPTSSNASFLTGLNGPTFLAVVPEPSTWAMVGMGVAGASVGWLRRRQTEA